MTDEPLCARHGDHVVVRDQGLDRTLGGGRILTDLPDSRRRRGRGRLARIEAFRLASPGKIFEALLKLGPVEAGPLQHTFGQTDAQFDKTLAGLNAEKHGNEWISRHQWAQWRSAVLDFIGRYHAERPDATGVRPNRLPAGIPARFRIELLNELVAAKALGSTAGAYHLPRHVASLPPAEKALLERVLAFLDVDQAPSVGDLAKRLGMPPDALGTGLKNLARRGLLAQVSAKRYYHPGRLAKIAGYAATLANSGPFTVRAFRDATGIGRNVAIEVLEHFDGKGVTRRLGDTRTVVNPLEL